MSGTLAQKIQDKTSVGGVIGLGYVGLPLVHHLCESGYRVIGFDVDPDKVEKLNAGKSYIKHLSDAFVQKATSSGRFEATTDFSRLAEADCISICVPTPLDEHFQPDLSYVIATAEAIAQTLRKDQLIILESTTYPGTTTEVLQPLFDAHGLKVGQDYFLAYSPEREDPGNAKFTIQTIPKVVGGITAACAELTATYYGAIFERIVMVSTTNSAEMTKLLENIFRSVNIALVNELKMMCDRMGMDVWEIIDAAATKPFGFMPFYPGPGLGGHCIPIDPFYLSWKAKEHEFPARFIELAGEINTFMPHYVVGRIGDALNNQSKPVRGARILLLGAAYKKDVDDVRESPCLKLIELLREKGAEVEYNDPHVPRLRGGRKYDLEMYSAPLTPDNLERYDCVVIVTDHTSYDYEDIVKNAQLVVDTRNATKGLGLRPNVFK